MDWRNLYRNVFYRMFYLFPDESWCKAMQHLSPLEYYRLVDLRIMFCSDHMLCLSTLCKEVKVNKFWRFSVECSNATLHGTFWILGSIFPVKLTRLAEQWFEKVYCTIITIFKHNNHLQKKIQTCQTHQVYKLTLIKKNYISLKS